MKSYPLLDRSRVLVLAGACFVCGDFSLALAVQPENALVSEFSPAEDADAKSKKLKKSRKFLDEYLELHDQEQPQKIKTEDREILQTLADQGYFHDAERLTKGSPKAIKFTARKSDGSIVTVLLTPGLEGDKDVADLFQIVVEKPRGEFQILPRADIRDLDFYVYLPSSSPAKQAKQKTDTEAAEKRIGSIITGASSIFGSDPNSFLPLLVLGVTGVTTPPKGISTPQPERRIPQDAYQIRNTQLYYSEKTGKVYSKTGEELGAYQALRNQLSGKGTPPRNLFAGPTELRYRPSSDGEMLSAPDGTPVGYKIRRGKEAFYFVHGDNPKGHAQGTPWMLYSERGESLGRLEQEVFLRHAQGYDGKTHERVLTWVGYAGEGSKKRAVLKDTEGLLYEVQMDQYGRQLYAGGQRAYKPFFDTLEQAQQYNQLQRLRQIQDMSEGPLRSFLMLGAQASLDSRFRERFPVASKEELAGPLLDAYRASLQQGDISPVLAYQNTGTRKDGKEGLVELLTRYQAEYQRDKTAYEEEGRRAVTVWGQRKTREEHIEALRGKRDALDAEIRALRASPNRWSSWGMNRERYLMDQYRIYDNQLSEVQRPILEAADKRNRSHWIVRDLQGIAQALQPDSPTPGHLADIKALREDLRQTLDRGLESRARAILDGKMTAGEYDKELAEEIAYWQRQNPRKRLDSEIRSELEDNVRGRLARRSQQEAEGLIRGEFLRARGVQGPQESAFEFTRLYETLPELENLPKRFQNVQKELAALPQGPESVDRRNELEAQVKDLRQRMYFWTSEQKGLRESLESTLSRAQTIHRGFKALAALDRRERESESRRLTQEEQQERQTWTRILKEQLRTELRSAPGVDWTVLNRAQGDGWRKEYDRLMDKSWEAMREDISRQWTGEAWDRYQDTLAYLEGVRSSQSWHDAIRVRRLMFDGAIRRLMDNNVDLDEKRKILRMS